MPYQPKPSQPNPVEVMWNSLNSYSDKETGVLLRRARNVRLIDIFNAMPTAL